MKKLTIIIMLFMSITAFSQNELFSAKFDLGYTMEKGADGKLHSPSETEYINATFKVVNTLDQVVALLVINGVSLMVYNVVIDYSSEDTDLIILKGYLQDKTPMYFRLDPNETLKVWSETDTTVLVLESKPQMY